MNNYAYQDQAQVAALLEANFSDIKDGRYPTNDLKHYHSSLEGYELLDVGTFETNGSAKAITVRDPNGNIYVHFNGTGDGNWGYNSAAYGTEPSAMQTWSEEYFNEMVKAHYEGNASNGALYVSGHSQGSNNAQYVTIKSQYGDYIEACIGLDGPGMSKEVVNQAKNQYGEAYYNSQRDKIFGYYGEDDFVSPLGQENIIREDQAYTVRRGEGFFPEGHDCPTDIGNKAHAAFYLLDGDGTLAEVRPYSYETNSAFRKLILGVNDRFVNLEQDQQHRTGQAVMNLVEQMIGDGESRFTAEDLQVLRESFAPILAEVLSEDKELILDVINEMVQKGDLSISPEMIGLIETILNKYDSLPENTRTQLVENFFTAIGIDENGKFVFELENMFTDWKFISTFKAGIPIIFETIINNPGDLAAVMHQMGIDKAMVEFLNNNSVGVSIVASILLASPVLATWALHVGITVVALVLVVDVVIRAWDMVVKGAELLFDFVTDCLKVLADTLDKIKEWARNTFNRGVQYVQQNKHFKIDPETFRGFARRLDSINSRLRTLDSNMNDLYWQVGLLDMYDIACINFATHGSNTIKCIRNYMNDTASRIEQADRKAQQLFT
ncbi:MAG: DUF2974 domain-containing protein [Lachnospiraceae bacterium]|nr:DUF2974 domain-containing protein [Lachnospiraceae bacterium]